MNLIEGHVQILGTTMRDKVSGMEGTVSSVCFDAYGCVQATLSQRYNVKKAEIPSGRWFDVKRLEPCKIKGMAERVLEVPAFATTPHGQEQGAADKPAYD